jgi:hypothetical protein
LRWDREPAGSFVRLLPTGLLIFLALVLLALSDHDRDVWTLIGIVLCLAAGVALVEEARSGREGEKGRVRAGYAARFWR